MKIEKVLKSNAGYPTRSVIKPIIFNAVAMVAFSGCGGNNLSPHKVIKPEPPVHVSTDNNLPRPEEPDPKDGIPPIEPVPSPKS